MKRTDFIVVERSIELSVLLIEEVDKLNIEEMNPDVRDFLLSQLKRTIGKVSNFVLKHD